MEGSFMEIVYHPQFFETLFAFRSKVLAVFNDVLGIYEINHIAISQISAAHEILAFSSTPAMEYNLFSSNLWRYDQSYHPQWFSQCIQADWQSLYTPSYYDDLYYLKQVKHHYPIGCTQAVKLEDNFFLYSFATHRSCDSTRELFAYHYDDFSKIGLYCTMILAPLFQSVSEAQIDFQSNFPSGLPHFVCNDDRFAHLSQSG